MTCKGTLKSDIRGLPNRIKRGRLHRAIWGMHNPVLRDSLKILVTPVFGVTLVAAVVVQMVVHFYKAIRSKMPESRLECAIFLFANAVQIVAPFVITYVALTILGKTLVAVYNVLDRMMAFAFSSMGNMLGFSFVSIIMVGAIGYAITRIRSSRSK